MSFSGLCGRPVFSRWADLGRGERGEAWRGAGARRERAARSARPIPTDDFPRSSTRSRAPDGTRDAPRRPDVARAKNKEDDNTCFGLTKVREAGVQIRLLHPVALYRRLGDDCDVSARFSTRNPGKRLKRRRGFRIPSFRRGDGGISRARRSPRRCSTLPVASRETTRLEPKYRGLTRGAGGRAAGRCAHQVSDPEGLHLAGLGGVRLRHRAPFGGSGGYAARRRRVRDTREIATCFFSPTGKRGSLICLRAGVFVNGRARPVDPKRGRCSEKGAELTREVLARAFARSLGVV